MDVEKSIYQAIKGLTSNVRRIDPKTDPVAWNQNQALLAIAVAVEKLSRDIEAISNRTDAILRSAKDL